MGIMGLLKNVPRNIKVPLNLDFVMQGRGHNLIVLCVGMIWVGLVFVIPISRFPITMSRGQLEAYGCPDYGIGMTYEMFRMKKKSFDFI